MKISVQLAEMRVSKNPVDVIMAHDLGSGMGLAALDPAVRVGGIFHAMLPDSGVFPDMARKKPLMFVDTGLPLFLQEILGQGAAKERLIIKMAGGSDFLDSHRTTFAVGRQNILKSEEILRNNGLAISDRETGGKQTRTLYLDIGNGKIWIEGQGA